MQQYTLLRSGQPPLVFDGDLLREVKPPDDILSRLKRWHVLRLYKTASGKYVVQIEFHTVYDPVQADVEVAEGVDQLRDICDEYVDDIPEMVAYPVTDRARARQKKLIIDKLQQHFEAAVAEILNWPEFAERV